MSSAGFISCGRQEFAEEGCGEATPPTSETDLGGGTEGAAHDSRVDRDLREDSVDGDWSVSGWAVALNVTVIDVSG